MHYKRGIIPGLLLLCQAGLAQDLIRSQPEREPGVSEGLAAFRAELVNSVDYYLSYKIPEHRDSAVVLEETIKFNIRDKSKGLQLDLKGGDADLPVVVVNGHRLEKMYEKEHIYIPTDRLAPGDNRVELTWKSKGMPLNRNKDFLYTLLVPDRARSLFACFDQPDMKARYFLTLIIPRGWKAIANGALQDTVGVGSEMTRWRFAPSDRVSTYLFAFVAGKFSEEARRRMHFLYRETDSTKIRLSMEPIFTIQEQALHFLEDYTAIKYPFQKFDFAAIPDFQFGGMEHPGAIQYKASSLFLDSGATREQLLGRSTLLSHETAHMWFGDWVTMRWFNDVWMKEVFANFMADKISNITMPDGLYDLKFLTGHCPAAYSIDRTAGAHPIRQRLDNLQEAGSLYGNIIYHKAPIMMRQLESMMGDTAFRNGLREYLAQYGGGNAGWPELIAILQRHTKADLETWNKVWVNEPGRPVFSYRMDATKGRIQSLRIEQRGEDGSTRVWPQVFGISLVYRDRVDEVRVSMDQASILVDAVKGKQEPQYVIFNSDGLGYGVFPFDRDGVEKMRFPENPVTRASIYINLYESMLNGTPGLNPQTMLGMYGFAIKVEHEELCLNLLLDQMVSLYWRFQTPAEREAMASGLEEALWRAIGEAHSAGEKKLLFRTYSNIALSKAGVDSLYRVWKEQRPPAGVTLTEDDYTNLAAALAIRNYPGSAAILDEQGSRITNKDRKERWDWLRPALSDDITDRDVFFTQLEKPEGRRKEAWVLTGLSYLHHPLRTGISEKYLPTMLALLEDVQRTGDVFFPQSWLSAGFAWYTSPSAARIVRRFLDEHPGYNEKLRAKILQATDLLMRTGGKAR